MAASISAGSLVLDLVLVLLGAFLLIYFYFKHSYQYWKKKGVPYLKPKFPYGNYPYALPASPTYAGESKVWYDELKKRGHKFGGAYSFSQPVLVLVDPDYIRDILSQDFQYFVNRDFYVNEEHDPMGTHLFNITNKGWKSLRQKFTPTFTSGKMKMMFNTVVKTSDNMIKFLEKCDKMGDDVDIREVLASFTTDVIGSVAFGIDCTSFDDTHKEFRNQGRTLFNMSLVFYMKALSIKNFPELCKKAGMKLGRESSRRFFSNAIKQTIEYREKNNIRRTDFLQILIDMNHENKDTEKTFSFEQIVANSVLFFIAGFDTSSTVMTYTLYELTEHQDIQEKVRNEINKVLAKYKGEVTYDGLQEMTYLRQVMDETMRLHPPVLSVARVCTKDYQLRDTDVTIEKGTPVTVSLLALGRDPEYYPDPLKFDPERFSHEKKQNRHPYIHIPFGEGPRNCIGLRFGIMQAQIGLVRVLTNFRLTKSLKTKTPVDYDPTKFLLKETETIYLRVNKI